MKKYGIINLIIGLSLCSLQIFAIIGSDTYSSIMNLDFSSLSVFFYSFIGALSFHVIGIVGLIFLVCGLILLSQNMPSKTYQNKNKQLTHIALLSAIGFLLMFIEFSVPFVPSFLKVDISELPALLMTFMYGPVSGIVVCLLKNVLHLIISNTGGVGELSNFLLGAIFCFTAGMIYKYHRTKKGAIVSMLIGAFVMAEICFFTNLYIMYPFYYNIIPKEAILGMCQAILPSIKSIEMSIIVFNVPFTFAKGLLCSAITFVVYKKLKKALKID